MLLLAQPAAATSDTSGIPLPQSGLNVHMSYFSTTYGSPYAESVPCGRYWGGLNQKWVRDELTTLTQTESWYNTLFNRWRNMSSKGCSILLILGKPGMDINALLQRVQPLVEEGVVDAIEGPNEWDTFGGYDGWWTDLRTYTKDLHTKAKAHPSAAVRALPIVAPSLAGANDSKAVAVGDLSAWVDFGNLHFYVGPTTAGSTMTKAFDATRKMSGTKPVWVTETGCSTGRGTPVCTEAQQKDRYEVSMQAFGQRGAQRVFYYEFIDCCGTNYGILRADWTHKPVWQSLYDAGSRG
jgi:hypothetical protein